MPGVKLLVVALLGIGSAVRRSAALTVADWRARLPGALARQSLILVGLALGVALLIAMLPFRSPFSVALGAG